MFRMALLSTDLPTAYPVPAPPTPPTTAPGNVATPKPNAAPIAPNHFASLPLV